MTRKRGIRYGEHPRRGRLSAQPERADGSSCPRQPPCGRTKDGVEALAKARAEHFDLVISDILLPRMDGFEFVRQMRNIPASALTPVTVSYTHLTLPTI